MSPWGLKNSSSTRAAQDETRSCLCLLSQRGPCGRETPKCKALTRPQDQRGGPPENWIKQLPGLPGTASLRSPGLPPARLQV